MKNRAAYKNQLLSLQVLTKKTVSKVILKQYKEPLSIRRNTGNGGKKEFAEQNKASKIIRISLKHPNMSGRKVAQKVGFC